MIEFNYIPTPKQRIFHETTAREVLYGGAAGGGKSYAIVWFDKIGALEGKNQNGSMDVTQDVDHVCVAGFDGDIDQKWLDLDNHRVIVAVSDVYYPDTLEPHASPVARNADGILTYPNGVLEPSSTPSAG